MIKLLPKCKTCEYHQDWCQCLINCHQCRNQADNCYCNQYQEVLESQYFHKEVTSHKELRAQ